VRADRRGHPALFRLKDNKVIVVADEDAPEEHLLVLRISLAPRYQAASDFGSEGECYVSR
jgi:hypothetical protein